MPDLAARARTLLDLHTAPEILVLANVWDVVSARVVAAVDGVTALATASHSIAATFGYEDGENIPLDLHLDMVRRITAAVDLPVTMDFEAGYGDAGETARRAMGAGAVGGNLEDRMRPLESMDYANMEFMEYLVYAIPAVIFLSICMAPVQVPDELHHSREGSAARRCHQQMHVVRHQDVRVDGAAHATARAVENRAVSSVVGRLAKRR